ncbi:hypothetical protein SAMN02745126_05203 [Enhydrobacter aerosaccus]|uniref:Uncharacterized protein n=1 Tax=Enhydrobacter aerosaccus TaxID=225324 RepID=A0A1T4SVQ4_9HYPH|nr:hypothetical protein SAMN02745126_05203 [Enhydrobacter aerosaccus]
MASDLVTVGQFEDDRSEGQCRRMAQHGLGFIRVTTLHLVQAQRGRFVQGTCGRPTGPHQHAPRRRQAFDGHVAPTKFGQPIGDLFEPVAAMDQSERAARLQRPGRHAQPAFQIGA